jgi:hypothetical protein
MRNFGNRIGRLHFRIELISTLREVGRHLADRNDLGVANNPETLALAVLLEDYAEEHKDDFQETAEGAAGWRYVGHTDAGPTRYQTVEELARGTEDDDGDNEVDDGKMRMTLSLDDGDDE